MTTKTIALKNLIEEIYQLGFNKDDRVVLLFNEDTVMIKKLFLQGDFRDLVSPIWEEAKKDNLTLQDIDDIVHQVRKAEKIENE
jgi:hypothetical protein